MATSVGSLFASLTLQSDQFVQGTRQAAQAANTMSGKITASFGQIVKGVGELAIIERVGAYFVEATKHAIDYAMSLEDTAKHAGVTVAQLQVLQQASIQTGVSQDKMVKGIQALNVELGKAQGGNKEAIKLFQDLKIQPDQLKSFHDGIDVLPKVMDGIKGLSTAAEQAAASQGLMKKAGKDLTSTLAEGSGAMDAWTAAANQAGMITDQEAARAHQAKVAMEELSTTLEHQLVKALLDNLPAIEALINGLARLISKAGQAISWLRRVSMESELADAKQQAAGGGDSRAQFIGGLLGSAIPGIGPVGGGLIGGALTNSAASRAAAQKKVDDLQNKILETKLATLQLLPDGLTGKLTDTGNNDLHLGGGGRTKQPKKPKQPAEDTAANEIGKLTGDLSLAQQKLGISPDDVAAMLHYNEQQAIFNNLQSAGKKATVAEKEAITDLSKKLADTDAIQKMNDEIRQFTQGLEESAKTMGMNDLQKQQYEMQKLIDKRKQLTDALRGPDDPNAIVVEGLSKQIAGMKAALADYDQAGFDQLMKGFKDEEAQLHMNSLELAVYNDLKGQIAGRSAEEVAALTAEATALEKERLAVSHVKDMAESFSQIPMDLFKNLIEGTQSWKKSFSDALKELGNMMIEELVLKPLKAMIVSGIEKLLLSLTGAAGSPGFTNIFTGQVQDSFVSSTESLLNSLPAASGHALGGPVDAGQPYWVGEKGPEMFVPSSKGSIIPNNMSGGGQNITINVDARNSTDPAAVKQQVAQGIMEAMPLINQSGFSFTMRKLNRPVGLNT